MKLKELKSILGDGTFSGAGHVHRVLPRYAAMAGIHITPAVAEYSGEAAEMEIPMEAVQKILALDFAERATADLRAMGEGIGKLHLPANINVWQHLKGEASIRHAADALTEAVQTMTERLTA